MRVLLVVNPTASSVTPHVRAEVEAVLGDACDLDVAETTSRGHASSLARDAVGAGVDVVAVLAGDGTLNEAAGGLAGSAVALGPLPGGSTNVFARTLGIAYAPADAARQLVDSLAHDRRRRIGLGAARAGDAAPRHFLFHLGVGFDAAVIRRMEGRASALKRHLAHPTFAAIAFTTWLRHYDRTTKIRFTVDGRVVAEGPYGVVSNSAPYSYVGHRALRIAPDASLDGALALTALRTLTATVTSRAAIAAVGRPTYLVTSPDVVQCAGLDEVEITGDAAFPWQVDGDYLGESQRLAVSFLGDCLTIVLP